MGGGGVIIPRTVDGQGNEGGILGENCLAVLHPQNVVGLGEQVGGSSQGFQRPLPGGRKAQPFLQMLPQHRGKGGAVQHPGGFHNFFRLGRFCPEAQVGTQPGENLHPPGGEPFRRGKTGGDGQLQHQVGTAGNRCLCPEGFIHNGRVSPLDKVAAHKAHHRRILPQKTFCQVQLSFVPFVQGIVFTNNACNLQNNQTS